MQAIIFTGPEQLLQCPDTQVHIPRDNPVDIWIDSVHCPFPIRPQPEPTSGNLLGQFARVRTERFPGTRFYLGIA